MLLLLHEVHFAGEFTGHSGELRYELLNMVIILLASDIGILVVAHGRLLPYVVDEQIL